MLEGNENPPGDVKPEPVTSLRRLVSNVTSTQERRSTTEVMWSTTVHGIVGITLCVTVGVCSPK
jgi:hypothetical protein